MKQSFSYRGRTGVVVDVERAVVGFATHTQRSEGYLRAPLGALEPTRDALRALWALLWPPPIVHVNGPCDASPARDALFTVDRDVVVFEAAAPDYRAWLRLMVDRQTLRGGRDIALGTTTVSIPIGVDVGLRRLRAHRPTTLVVAPMGMAPSLDGSIVDAREVDLDRLDLAWMKHLAHGPCADSARAKVTRDVASFRSEDEQGAFFPQGATPLSMAQGALSPLLLLRMLQTMPHAGADRGSEDVASSDEHDPHPVVNEAPWQERIVGAGEYLRALAPLLPHVQGLAWSADDDVGQLSFRGDHLAGSLAFQRQSGAPVAAAPFLADDDEDAVDDDLRHGSTPARAHGAPGLRDAATYVDPWGRERQRPLLLAGELR